MSDPFRFIQFQFCDLLGHMRAMIVPCKPASSLEEVAEDPVMSEGTSIDGSSAGFATVEASDLKLIPDPSTLVEIPYLEHRTAAVMCYVERKGKGGTYPLDSRGVLRSVCSRLLTSRRQLMVKTEPEFYFISSDGELVDHARYADVYPLSPAADALTEIAAVVQDMGMRVRVVHHEAGESQQEIELDYDDTIRMADNLLRFKNVARAITRERGLDVTFMPKPFEDMAGSGLHCHMQLWEGDRNLFGAGEGQLSETAEMFAAGLLKHAPAITAIANPTVNSYKRLVPHHEAPVYICWGPV
ncbi:MAG: glutamine synthetase family protein, partial [Candidatus Thorarchaeota archaeon]